MGGNLQRLQPPLQTDAFGRAERTINFNADPVLSDITLTVPGQWNFQFWHRDNMGSSNLTDAVAIDFFD